MLIKLSPEQVSKYWKFIEIALKVSVIPTVGIDEDKIFAIRDSLFEGRAVCWAEGDEKSPRTIVITSIKIDPLSETRNMLIYCAHGFRKADSVDYIEMIRVLSLYAISRGCSHIISYVSNDKIIKLMQKYGALAEYTLVVFPLRKNF